MAISRRQNAFGSSASTTLDAGTAAGSLIVVAGRTTGAVPSSVSDDKSNPYTIIASVTMGGGVANPVGFLAYAKNAIGGVTTITVHGATIFLVVIAEFTGVSTNPLDTSASDTGSFAGTSGTAASGSFVTTVGGDLIIGWCVDEGTAGATGNSLGAGYTSIDTSNGFLLEQAIQTSQGAVNPYASIVGQPTGTNYWGMIGASFKTATPPPPDFIIASTGTQTVKTGTSATYTITATPLNSYAGTLTPSVTSGLPSGAVASFSPSTMTSGGSWQTTMTVTTTGVAAGNSTLTVSATDGTLTHTTTSSLAVLDFSLSVAPSSATVYVGTSATYTVTLAALNGYTGTLTPSVSGLPTGAGSSWSPTTVTNAGDSTVTVTTVSVAPGTSTLTFSVTDGTITHTATATLVVIAVPVTGFSNRWVSI